MAAQDQPSGTPPLPPASDGTVITTTDPDPAPQSAPTARRKVILSGREVEVEEDVADAIEGRELEFKQRLAEQGEELGRLRRAVPTEVENPPVPTTPKRDFSKLLFENPEQFVTELKNDIRKEVTDAYVRDQGEQRFWRDFQSQYPDLGHAAKLARMVLAEHYQVLQSLTVDEAQKRLATLTRQEIARLSKATADGGSPRTVVEGGAPPSPPRPGKGQPTPTMGTIIQQRQEARRQAQTTRKPGQR